MSKIDPVIHFEMPAEDPERVKQFYEEAFGWVVTPLGEEAGDFILAFTADVDPETRIPTKRGVINGGFYKRTDSDDQTKLTILVDDIHEAMEKVKATGGTILDEEPFELPGVGLFVSFTDTEGNVLTLNQDFAVKSLPDAK